MMLLGFTPPLSYATMMVIVMVMMIMMMMMMMINVDENKILKDDLLKELQFLESESIVIRMP